jgi:L-alanine-DL-glutamate epimerase-like enolase superfamily enzyme
MKVTGVKVTPYAFPPAGKPAGRHATSGSIVELMTDSGLTGIAIGADGAHTQIERLVGEMLVGADPRATSGLWRQMTDAQATLNEGFASTTIAVLDVALWDLKSKANDEPLWKTLGGSRPRANAHGGGIAPTMSDHERVDWYRALSRDYGLRGATLVIGGDEDRDLARLEAMRTTLRQETTAATLIVDAEQRWAPDEAIRRLRTMERMFDVAWVEGATRSGDIPGLKQISDAIRGAVCVGRDLGTRAEFLPHFQDRSADVIELDIGVVGITGALELADAAYGFELPVTLAEAPGNIQAHLASVMPYFMSMEVVDPTPQWPVFASDVRIEAGWATAGDAHGHGLTVNRDGVGHPGHPLVVPVKESLSQVTSHLRMAPTMSCWVGTGCATRTAVMMTTTRAIPSSSLADRVMRVVPPASPSRGRTKRQL